MKFLAPLGGKKFKCHMTHQRLKGIKPCRSVCKISVIWLTVSDVLIENWTWAVKIKVWINSDVQWDIFVWVRGKKWKHDETHRSFLKGKNDKYTKFMKIVFYTFLKINELLKNIILLRFFVNAVLVWNVYLHPNPWA